MEKSFIVGQTRTERGFWDEDIGDDVEGEESILESNRRR